MISLLNRAIGRRFSSALVVALALASASVAQPPNYTRWSGATALTQSQGLAQGDPLTLTWGFMLDGTALNQSGAGEAFAPSNLRARLNTIYGNQATWQPLFQSVFDRWSSISGLSYQFEASDDGGTFTGGSTPAGLLGVRADIRIGGKLIDGNSGVLAYNYFPNGGDMVIDTGDNFFDNIANTSLRLRNVVAHEHGHGMGMPHMDSNNASFLMEPFINLSFNGPQYHDILAAQRMYGDANEKSNAGLGNDTSARATAMGNLTTAAPLRVGTSARTFVVASTETDFVSIDDNTDTDFYKFTVTNQGILNAYVEPIGFIYNITAQGAGGNVPFDSKLRSDLSLALIGLDGTTVLASTNLNGLGGNEHLFFSLLTTGTYFLRITGVDNIDSIALDTQFYGLSLFFSPVPEPSTKAMIGLSAALAWGWTRRRRTKVRGLA